MNTLLQRPAKNNARERVGEAVRGFIEHANTVGPKDRRLLEESTTLKQIREMMKRR